MTLQLDGLLAVQPLDGSGICADARWALTLRPPRPAGECHGVGRRLALAGLIGAGAGRNQGAPIGNKQRRRE